MLLRISFPCQKEIICIDLKRKKLYRSELSGDIAKIDVINAKGAKMLKSYYIDSHLGLQAHHRSTTGVHVANQQQYNYEYIFIIS